MTARSVSDRAARETLDAIRLAVEGASDDRRAINTIKALLADGPAPDPHGTGSPRRLVRAWKRVRRAEHWSRG